MGPGTTGDELERVIASSPARPLPEPAYVIRAESGEQFATGDLALLQDDTDTTLVTAGLDRLAAARRAGRPYEGPFTVVRLEVSVPFVAPGFIAAATSACAASGINVFVLSTFSYDYLLVPVANREAALSALQARGFPLDDDE